MTPVFNARLYDSSTGKNHAVQFQVQSNTIVLDNGATTIPYSEISFDITGHEEDRIKISCPSHNLALICTDKNLLEALVRADKSGLRAAELQRLTKKTRALPVLKRTYWLRVIAVLAALAAGTWLSLGLLVDAAAQRIDPKMEISLGRASLSKKFEKHSKAAKRVQAVGERLVSHLKNSPYEFEFFATKDSTVNAFALPGGFIVVNTGLIDKLDNDDELAGVMGHEIGHVIHRDSVRTLLHSGGILCCIGILAGTFGENGEKLAETLMVAQSIERQSFSRAQEARADITGCDLAVQAGYDGEGMVKFFKKISKEPNFADNKFLALLSDHPMTEDRVTAIKAELQRLKSVDAAKESDVNAKSGKVDGPVK